MLASPHLIRFPPFPLQQELPLQLQGPWPLKQQRQAALCQAMDTNALPPKPHFSCPPKSVARAPVIINTGCYDSHLSFFSYSESKSSVSALRPHTYPPLSPGTPYPCPQSVITIFSIIYKLTALRALGVGGGTRTSLWSQKSNPLVRIQGTSMHGWGLALMSCVAGSSSGSCPDCNLRLLT